MRTDFRETKKALWSGFMGRSINNCDFGVWFQVEYDLRSRTQAIFHDQLIYQIFDNTNDGNQSKVID